MKKKYTQITETETYIEVPRAQRNTHTKRHETWRCDYQKQEQEDGALTVEEASTKEKLQ